MARHFARLRGVKLLFSWEVQKLLLLSLNTKKNSLNPRVMSFVPFSPRIVLA
ncbi:hypothetical protein GPROT1_01261 [Gammaproteobacteria bacterium]|nr:hypothetical protein GPROT1_01261 [Gammaproteobacteria bacterium]